MSDSTSQLHWAAPCEAERRDCAGKLRIEVSAEQGAESVAHDCEIVSVEHLGGHALVVDRHGTIIFILIGDAALRPAARLVSALATVGGFPLACTTAAVVHRAAGGRLLSSIVEAVFRSPLERHPIKLRDVIMEHPVLLLISERPGVLAQEFLRVRPGRIAMREVIRPH